MKTKIVNEIRKQRSIAQKTVIGLCLVIGVTACEKAENVNVGDGIVISKTGYLSEPISSLDLAVGGGKDTIYVFSKSPVAIATNGIGDWMEVIKQEYVSDLKATRVVLEFLEMEEDFKRRAGTLNVSNESSYSRNFLSVKQGYSVRYSNDFSWLRYGNGNPLDLEGGVLIGGWNPTQQQQGWTSSIMNGQDKAYLYGKNNYVQLGAETVGADLQSPMVPEVQKDSLFLLTFNAVAFVSKTGDQDQNMLTIQLNGGEFDNGEQSVVVELPHFDKGSALLTTKMWENSFFKLNVHKPKLTPNSSTFQIRFIGGGEIAEPQNRVFLDNINLYTVAQFEQKK